MGFDIENGVILKYIDDGRKTVVIPDGVKEIASSAFMDCRNIVTAEIPDSVKLIRSYAFGNCSSLENISFSAYTEIEEKAFSCCSFRKVTVRDSIAAVTVCSANTLLLRLFMTANPTRKEQMFRNATPAFKIPFAIYLAFVLDSSPAFSYMKKDIVAVMNYLTDREDIENIRKILPLGYVKREHIDDIIKHAIDKRKYEIQIMLTNFKKENFGFSDDFSELIIK